MFQQHMSEPNPFINEAAKLIRGNKENWKEEALDNPQLYGMSPDTYQLFLNRPVPTDLPCNKLLHLLPAA